MVYSRVSFHSTLDRKHFHDYVQRYFGQVSLGNDKTCKIIGMGKDFINKHNGNQWLLKEIKHVLDMKKNII